MFMVLSGLMQNFLLLKIMYCYGEINTDFMKIVNGEIIKPLEFRF